MGEEPAEYGLVMPFVVCQSKGGPYEDQAFVAGYQAGQLDRRLEVAELIHAPAVRSGPLYAGLVPQAELLGMKHGFPVVEVVADDNGWVELTFRSGQVG